jgi:nucleoside-diphosphate-sugar epimerase
VPDTESGKAILEAENLLQNEASISATILRFGGMIGPERNPARFFSGKKEIPNGKAPVNLIHLDDCIEVTLEIIKQDAFGHVFNACASIHPSKNDFYTQAAMRSNLELPEFKDELNRWKIVSSNNLKPVLGLSLTHL